MITNKIFILASIISNTIPVTIHSLNITKSVKHEYDFSSPINAYEKAKNLCNSGTFNKEMYSDVYSFGMQTAPSMNKCIKENRHIKYYERITDLGLDYVYAAPIFNRNYFKQAERKMIDGDPIYNSLEMSFNIDTEYNKSSITEVFDFATTSYKKTKEIKCDKQDIIYITEEDVYLKQKSQKTMQYSNVLMTSLVKLYDEIELLDLFPQYKYYLSNIETETVIYSYEDTGSKIIAKASHLIEELHEPSDFITTINRTITLEKHIERLDFELIKTNYHKKIDKNFLVEYQWFSFKFE